MPTVLVYSDQPILAKGVESVLAADATLKLCGCCAKVSTFKEFLASARPDVALVDLTPQITTGTLTELRGLAPDCKFILWTNGLGGEFALHALTMGIRGVLRKTLPLDALLHCLRRVEAGELWFEKSLTDSFRSSRRVELSPRESQLVTLLARGMKNKEISTELGITEGTVKVYLSHLFQKSGAKDRFDLALHGLKNLSMAGAVMEGQGGLRSLVMETSCRA
ncbi:MAG TPA: response regulator transcription factor [Bryobacteraceae bacterium]|nr:response regulator transcription factor [Bryobacteraceae bacterium]